MNFSMVFLVLSIVIFVFLAHMLAKRKGLNPVFWGVMGGVFGPLVLPVIILIKSPQHKDKESE